MAITIGSSWSGSAKFVLKSSRLRSGCLRYDLNPLCGRYEVFSFGIPRSVPYSLAIARHAFLKRRPSFFMVFFHDPSRMLVLILGCSTFYTSLYRSASGSKSGFMVSIFSFIVSHALSSRVSSGSYPLPTLCVS